MCIHSMASVVLSEVFRFCRLGEVCRQLRLWSAAGPVRMSVPLITMGLWKLLGIRRAPGRRAGCRQVSFCNGERRRWLGQRGHLG